MKKILSALTAAALVLAMAGLFAACGKPADVTLDLPGIMTELAAKTKMPAEFIDIQTDEDLMDYYGLDAKLIRSYAIRQNASGYEDEIVMVEANDEAAALTVATMLESHRDDNKVAMRDYSPDMFELLNKTTVDVHGRYVSMFVSADAENMKAIFNEHLAG